MDDRHDGDTSSAGFAARYGALVLLGSACLRRAPIGSYGVPRSLFGSGDAIPVTCGGVGRAVLPAAKRCDLGGARYSWIEVAGSNDLDSAAADGTLVGPRERARREWPGPRATAMRGEHRSVSASASSNGARSRNGLHHPERQIGRYGDGAAGGNL